MFIRKGGGSGATTLSALTDTSISSPSDGQILGFNGITGKWENQNPSGGGVATSVVGTVENNSTASKAYAVGEHFIRNDKFCTAIAAIASGATLTLNTNYVEGTIAEAITYRDNYSADETVIGTWFGQTLYRKCFNVATMPNNTSLNIKHGITNARIVKCYGFAGSKNVTLPSGTYISFAYDKGSSIYCVVLGPNLQITTTTNYSEYEGGIILEYIKNS